MRADMFKVIINRPRWGSNFAPSPKLARKLTADYKHIGMKRHALLATPYTKHLNENLAPLTRFLRSKRGRHWDDVFSEICAQLDTGSTVKMHVRLHLEDLVATRISIGRQGEWMFEGKVLNKPDGLFWPRWHFFVDPRDGILKDYADIPFLKGDMR